MKNLIAMSAVVTALATSASAATIGWGFKSVDGVADGATEITWAGGSVKLIQTDQSLTVEVLGLDTLPVPADPTVESGLVAWVADWAAPMGLWSTFDLYLMPSFNTYCPILITPIMRDFQENSVGDYVWDNPNTADNGHCIRDQNNVSVTVQLQPVPLPAGALLLLTGVAGLGMMRRKR